MVKPKNTNLIIKLGLFKIYLINPNKTFKFIFQEYVINQFISRKDSVTK